MNRVTLILTFLVVLLLSPATTSAQNKPAKPPKQPPTQEEKKPIYTGKDVPQGKLENLVAKVGPGGLTKAEYDFYLLKIANRSGKNVESLTPEEKKVALRTGIEDELVFQAALAEGALRDDYTCWTIICEYKSRHITSQIDPESFTEDELRAFYKARPDLFTTPATFQARALKLPGATDQEAAKIRKQVAAKPDSRTDWIELGTFKEGDNPGGMSAQMAAQIFKLKKGQVSEVITDKYTDGKFIFQVTDRSEPKLMPFEEARGKAKFEYISVKSAELKKGLSLPKADKNMSEDQLILNTAVAEGVHRSLTIRDRIIQCYLAKKNSKADQLSPELRKRFKIELL